MTADRVGSSPAHDRAERGADDHDVVRVADHRDEVGHDVDREREVREQEPQPDPEASRQLAIASHPPQEAHEVGEQPEGLGRGTTSGSAEQQERRERQPGQHQGDGQAHSDPHEHRITPPHRPRLSSSLRIVTIRPRGYR